MSQENPVFLHFGGSWSGPAPYEFANFDASPTLLFEKIPLLGRFVSKNQHHFPKNVFYGNVITGLPVQYGSFNGAYCSHVLEHMSSQDCKKACSNVFNYLCHDGVFRLVMPDLYFYARLYVSHDIDSIDFLKQTGLGHSTRCSNIFAHFVSYFSNSTHLWMWDYESMSRLLYQVGFRSVRLASYGDSQIPEFSLVENEHRWNGEPTFGIEAIK